MPRNRTQPHKITQLKKLRSRRFGPKVVTPIGNIPLGTNSADLDHASIDKQCSPAWRVETMPKIQLQPNKANYYKQLFKHGVYKRQVWQYMFGGILRAIFGIYSNSRYWNRELELKLTEDLKEDYAALRASGLYYVDNYIATRNTNLNGARWWDEQLPIWGKKHFQEHTPTPIREGTNLVIRVDRGNGFCDVQWGIGHKIVRITYQQFLRRIADGAIIKVRSDYVPAFRAEQKIIETRKRRLRQLHNVH